MTENCGKGRYFDGANCAPCSAACDNAVARNNVQECKNLCYDLYQRLYGNESNTAPRYYIEIWLPIALIAICTLVVLSAFIIKRRRSRVNRRDQVKESNLPLTVEESPAVSNLPTDSGISTYKSEDTHQALQEMIPNYVRADEYGNTVSQF